LENPVSVPAESAPCYDVEAADQVRVHVGDRWLRGRVLSTDDQGLELQRYGGGETLRFEWPQVRSVQRYTGDKDPREIVAFVVAGAGTGYSVGVLVTIFANFRNFMCEGNCYPEREYRPRGAITGAVVGLAMGLSTFNDRWVPLCGDGRIGCGEGRIGVSLAADGRGAQATVAFRF
jgi:hypothetical protein